MVKKQKVSGRNGWLTAVSKFRVFGFGWEFVHLPRGVVELILRKRKSAMYEWAIQHCKCRLYHAIPWPPVRLQPSLEDGDAQDDEDWFGLNVRQRVYFLDDVPDVEPQ